MSKPPTRARLEESIAIAEAHGTPRLIIRTDHYIGLLRHQIRALGVVEAAEATGLLSSYPGHGDQVFIVSGKVRDYLRRAICRFREGKES